MNLYSERIFNGEARFMNELNQSMPTPPEADNGANPEAGASDDAHATREMVSRDLEARYRLLCEAGFEGVILHDGGRIIDVNPSVTVLTGYSLDDLVDGDVLHLVAPEDREIMKRCLADGAGAYEMRVQRKHDEPFAAQLRTREAVPYQGATVSATSIYDVSHRRPPHSALYREIVETTSDLVQTVSPEGKLLYANQAWYRTLGYDDGDLANLHLRDIVSPEHDELCQLALRRMSEDGSTDLMELTLVTRDGESIEVEGRCSWGQIADDPPCICVIFRDVTLRNRLSRMRDDLVAVVSHELRTPLTSIRGALGLVLGLAAGDLPARIRSLIDVAYANSERLSRLIDDILDLRRIESGQMVLDLQRVDLVDVVSDALDANRGYAEQCGVRFALEAPTSGLYVRGDIDRLMQVLANLLSNAAKYSPPGQNVVVDVSAVNADVTRVSVTDFGPGIPEDFRDRVFERFARARDPDQERRVGSGMGLSIARALIQLMGGQIAFDTKVGAGTTFYFDLPRD